MFYMINKDSITSVSDIEINPAGPKELLIDYGGHMTIEMYRSNCKILGREYHLLMPPFVPITLKIDEINNNNDIHNNISINNVINSSNQSDSVIIKNLRSS